MSGAFFAIEFEFINEFPSDLLIGFVSDFVSDFVSKLYAVRLI